MVYPEINLNLSSTWQHATSFRVSDLVETARFMDLTCVYYYDQNQGDETIFFHFSVHTTDTFPKMWDIYIWNLVDICLDPKGLLVHEAKSDNIYDQNVFNLKLRSYKCYNFLSAQVKKKYIYCNISLYMYYSSIWSVRSKKRTKFVYWYIASPRSHIPIKAAFGHPFMLT